MESNMSPQEFEYLKRAVAALESGEHGALEQHKILMTVSQITARAADKITAEFEERVALLQGAMSHG
jgi:hypothetical protein